MFNPTELQNALTYALKAMDKDNYWRSILTYVYVDLSVDNYVTFVGANGSVLHTTTINEPHTDQNSFFIPYSVASQIAHKTRKTGSPVSWYVQDNTTVFSQVYKRKTYTWVCDQPIGKYPDWRVIIPDLAKTQEITLSHETINKLCDIFGAIGSVLLSGNTAQAYPDKPYETTMKLPESVGVTVGVNPNYLYNAHNGSDFMTLYVMNPTAPITVHNSTSQTAIIMPMSIAKS